MSSPLITSSRCVAALAGRNRYVMLDLGLSLRNEFLSVCPLAFERENATKGGIKFEQGDCLGCGESFRDGEIT